MSTETKHAAHLFSAYFHQDCLVDDPDWESVVLRFRRSEPLDVVRRTQTELADLLKQPDESALERLLADSFYDPRPEGLSLRAWFEEILHLLAGGSPRTSDRMGISRSRREAAAVARGVLAGTRDPIVSARELARLRFSVGVNDDDPDFTCFVAIDSETDALPVGPERERWSAEALARLEQEITGARTWASTYGRLAFENVVRRFGEAG
jgi:hypothetical protein